VLPPGVAKPFSNPCFLAFWFEAFFRRSSKAPKKAWPAEVLHLHAEFSELCEKKSKAVLLLFGAPNREDFLRRYKNRVQEQHIQVTNTERVAIGLVHDDLENLSFIVVFCPHPEWLFWHWTVWAGRYVDACELHSVPFFPLLLTRLV
jgi:hypothetical protein